jgi:hypothetical protein
MMVSVAESYSNGIIERHDLELADAWSEKGAIVEPVRYGEPQRNKIA